MGKKLAKTTVAVPAHYTSQQGSHCGSEVKKSLSTRTHRCKCGDQIDRDENAAVNILRLGLRTTGHVGTYAWRDSASSWVGEIQSKQAESLNQASLTSRTRAQK